MIHCHPISFVQGSANPHIRVVLEGELEVRRDGTLTYILEEGNFVSEAGLHAGLMLTGTIESCASIVVNKKFNPNNNDVNNAASAIEKGGAKNKNDNNISNNKNNTNNNNNNTKNKVRLLCWDRVQLMELLENDKGLRNSLKAALSWDIVRKLKAQRHMLTEGRVQDPAAWTRKREDQGISRYAAILKNMLHHPDAQEQVNSMSEKLTKYRMIHHIEDRDHERALAKCGWTEEEFRNGRKKNGVVGGEEDNDEFYYDDDISEKEFLDKRWRRVKRFSSKLVQSLL